MKKVFIMFAMLFLSSHLVLAQDSSSGPMMEKAKMGYGMMDGQRKKMCPMHGMMMKSMMKIELVATSDGGIVVLTGNKLTKYDKNLNVVKETEIQSGEDAMHKMMMKMKEQCRMCPMMKKGMPNSDDAADVGDEGTQGAEDHESHH